jgi:hypothetical protein
MQFRVGAQAVTDDTTVSSTLEPAPALAPTTGIAKTWTIGLDQTHHVWTINGHPFSPSRISDDVTLGDTQEWKIVNKTHITHFIHLHEEQWQTIRRDGGPPHPWELGVQDTWQLDPGESIVVKGHFTDYPGLFMIHCHMLDHEDHGLMAQFDVKRPAAPATTIARADARHPRAHHAGMAGMADMRYSAVQAARTTTLPHGVATTSSDQAASFLQRFVIRLCCLLALAAVAALLRNRLTRRRAA